MSMLPQDFVAASHAILFEDNETHCCDVCAVPVDPRGEDEGYDVRGRGLLVWTRGDERRYEERLLCPRCATAVGVSALLRLEIEEEEG